jgi:hypothetical protein
VLERIKESGDIFWAQSDRPWILDGAHVHVSMVGFDDRTEKSRTLDDQLVTEINANLTSTLDLTRARRLKENEDLAFQGMTRLDSRCEKLESAEIAPGSWRVLSRSALRKTDFNRKTRRCGRWVGACFQRMSSGSTIGSRAPLQCSSEVPAGAHEISLHEAHR